MSTIYQSQCSLSPQALEMAFYRDLPQRGNSRTFAVSNVAPPQIFNIYVHTRACAQIEVNSLFSSAQLKKMGAAWQRNRQEGDRRSHRVSP